MPAKSNEELGVCIRPEEIIGNFKAAKEFVLNIIQSLDLNVKKENGDECNLICEEETIASERVNECESPSKKNYTYSSNYKRIENLVYENLIFALQKIS